MTYLALDIGSSSVTAAVWSSDGLVATASAFAEPTPRAWWTAVETAVVSLDADLISVEAMGCCGPWLPVAVASSGEPLPTVDDSRVEWVVSARDFVASLLAGRLATDPTMASASGTFSADGVLLGSSPGAPQRGSTEVLGDLLLPAARRLGLRSRIPVVTGATSLVCMVEGAGPAPVVSFGSPVTLAVPVTPPAADPPSGVTLLAGGRSYQVYEAPLHGLTEALSLLESRTGRSLSSLAAAAAAAAPGSDPVRAAYESVASSLATLLSALAPDAPFVYASGVADRAWRSVLPAVTGLPLVHRRSPDVTTCGLAMLVATGAGAHLDRDVANPVLDVDEPYR